MFKLTLIALLALTVVLAKRPKWHELEGYTFERYVKDHRKPYKPEEERYTTRKGYFDANLKRIQKHNADLTHSWKAGVNAFTDMSTAEFKRYNKFHKGANRAAPTVVHSGPTATDVPLPTEVDWRTATSPRVLTAIKHQGSCGSCWAHSATESLEAQYALLTGMLSVLSMAQINSCTPQDYNCAGCNGGDYVGAWQYLANTSVVRPTVLQSVTENWAYPQPLADWYYEDQNSSYVTSACLDISTQWKTPASGWFAELQAVAVSGYGAVNSNNATGGPAAMKALRDVGPQSVSVAAGNWQWYESGVFENTGEWGGDNEWGIDHAVQMVGYGHDKDLDKDYWIVRNSWGALWGIDGYIHLYKAKLGEAEPCSPASYGPVCGTSGVLSDLAYPIVFQATPTQFG